MRWRATRCLDSTNAAARPKSSLSPNPGFDSVFSGNTTDICPGRRADHCGLPLRRASVGIKRSASICTQCPVGCNITFNTRREAKADGKIVIKRVMPRQNEEVNEIWLCDKGRFAYHYAESKKRLSKPISAGRMGQSFGRALRGSAAIKLAGGGFVKAKKNLVVLASGRLVE